MAEPTSVTQNQIGFAPEVAPYATELLGRGQALATQTPYQAYQGEQVAQFSPLQQQSYDYATQMQSSPQLQDATAMAGQAGLGALNAQYTYNPSDFNSAFSGATTRDAQGNVTGNSMMNPYMQNVVDVQSQQAKRQAAIQNQGMQAQAANAGAFGGGRDAIMRAQSNAELQRNLQGIQATGLNNAYTQAMNQYNTQNQQNAQQQQFGASLGMQGLGLANTAANTLGSLGQTQYAQNMGLVGLQNQMGLQQQQQAQNVLNTQYQNYLSEQNHPYKQLGFYSDIIRGVPLTSTGSAVYQSSPTMMQNLTSLGLGAYGLSSLFGGQGTTGTTQKASGGTVQSYANGGSVMSPEFKRYAVDRIDPRQLQLAQRNAMARGDRETAGYTADEMAEDAALRRGVAAALPQGVDVVRAAGGGILAFAKGDLISDEEIDSLVDEEEGNDTGGTYTANPQVGSIVNSLLNTQIRTLSPSAQRKLDAYYLQRGEADLGPNLAAEKFQKYLDESEGTRASNMARGHGLTALRAAAALQKPGTTSGGRWGEMLGAVASSEEKLQAADQSHRQHLAKAQFDLADATRKERAGNVKDARAATASYVKNMQDSQKQEMLSKKYGAELLVNQERARALASRGAGAAGKPKFLEDTARMQDQLVDLKANPKTDPAQIKALEDKIAGRLKIYGTGKDIGPGKADVEAAKLAASTDKDIDALVKSAKFMDAEWQNAMGDSKKQAEIERRIRNEFVTRRNQEVNKNSGKSGKVEPIKIPD